MKPLNAPQPQAKRAADQRGRHAEFWAGLWLMMKGYSVLERRVRHPAGEIDMIVLRGKVLAFVEVKVRPSLELAKAAVSPRQREGIVRAASSWTAKRPWTAKKQWRFDVVAFGSHGLPQHLPDAWRPDYDPQLTSRKPKP